MTLTFIVAINALALALMGNQLLDIREQFRELDKLEREFIRGEGTPAEQIKKLSACHLVARRGFHVWGALAAVVSATLAILNMLFLIHSLIIFTA
jgi:hypothetical protein